MRVLIDIELVLIKVLLCSDLGAIAGKDPSQPHWKVVVRECTIESVRFMRPMPVTGSL